MAEAFWLVFIAHLIGDFLLQTDPMAMQKKESNEMCLTHIITYIIPFVFLIPVGIISWWVVLLIATQHYVQDRTHFIPWLMDITNSKGFRDNLGPWSIIVVDQVVHLSWMTLLVVLQYTVK
jgi:uncharacterized membrane protein